MSLPAFARNRRALVASCLLAGAGAVSLAATQQTQGHPVLEASASNVLPAVHDQMGGGQSLRDVPARADRDLGRAALDMESLTAQGFSGAGADPAKPGTGAALGPSTMPSASRPQTLQEAAAEAAQERQAAAAAAAEAAKKAKAAAAAKAETARLAQLHRWVRPNYGSLSSPFGHRWGRMHEGVDLAGGYGSPIVAATAGRVVYAGPESGYGRVVKILDWDGTQTWYGHMSTFLVKAGDTVVPGQQIALVGSAGDATGPHLHFEVRVNGAPINPIPFLADRGVGI